MNQSKQIFWQKQINDWQASGQTQVSFCAAKNLNKHTFQYWKKRSPKDTGSSVLNFLPVEVQSREKIRGIDQPSLTLRFKDDFLVQVSDDFSEATLIRLIRALEEL